MKAVVCEGYGGPEVLRFKEVPKPSPRDNEVLIKVRATTVSSGDWRVRSLEVPAGFGLMSRLALGVFSHRQPILGTELAGDVEAVGKDVTKFKAGDGVVAFSGARMGCHAEYKVMPEDGALAMKPPNLSYEEAAALSFGGTTALYFFKRAKLQGGEKVLINGASGAVGTAAVQLARHLGAQVTGVCSAANLDLVRSIGADRVIDYTNTDFAQNGETYDVIMDTAGTAPFSRCQRSLKDGGRLIVVLGSLSSMLQAPWVSLTSNKKVIAGPAVDRPEDVRLLADLAVAGKYLPVIDRRYPFEQIVEAHRLVDAGHKKGSVVITMPS
jgi:NADPH:quinone reductase-like Zn-dependent oxidoreductase